MNKANIHIKNESGKTTYHQLRTAPASWTEMTREHLLLWAASMCSTLTVKRAAEILTAMLYGIPEENFISIPQVGMDDLVKSMKFLFGKNMLTNWLIPSIWLGIFKYHGPKKALVNITIYEFGLCEHCYEQFQATKNREYLETLVAILYRPRRLWGIDDDIRIKLTTYGYVNRSKRFKKLPERFKVAVLLNYEGCRNALHNKFKEVFMPGKATKKASKPAQIQPVTPWAKIIEAGANDIFGTLSATKDSNLHEFLSRLNTRNKLHAEMDGKSGTHR